MDLISVKENPLIMQLLAVSILQPKGIDNKIAGVGIDVTTRILGTAH